MTTADGAERAVDRRYHLVERAGEGGMAEVWRGELVGAAGFRRPVAIKRVLPHLADATAFREMFVEEARVSSTLDHPNVVQVFDLAEDASGLYLVMEWVDGVTLRDIAQHWSASGQPAPPELAAAVGIEVLRALDAAHRRVVAGPGGVRTLAPVIHRDVSPSNVLVSAQGVVKLADFGLARALDRARMTPDGIVKGKLGYLSPEQATGQPATERSDVYSLGVMLWELLCGRRINADATDAEIIRALVSRTPHPRVRAVRRRVPRRIARAIDRAVRMDPDARFASAATMLRELCDALRHERERTDAARLGAVVARVRSAAPSSTRAARPSRGDDDGGSGATLEPSDVPVVYSVGEVTVSSLADVLGRAVAKAG